MRVPRDSFEWYSIPSLSTETFYLQPKLVEPSFAVFLVDSYSVSLALLLRFVSLQEEKRESVMQEKQQETHASLLFVPHTTSSSHF